MLRWFVLTDAGQELGAGGGGRGLGDLVVDVKTEVVDHVLGCQ